MYRSAFPVGFEFSSKYFISMILIAALLVLSSLSFAEHKTVVNLGFLNQEKAETIIRQSIDRPTSGQKVALISAEFLEAPYLAGTLIGGVNEPETLVMRFDGVDCFTLLDYVEALRRSSSFADFKDQLTAVRYKNGQVGYLSRNHFFTDWPLTNSAYIQNVTRQVGGLLTESADKTLNLKKDGDTFLDGYPTIQRRIDYIPADRINTDTLNRLEVGDYIGFYSAKAGLDVSHTGIIIKRQGKIYLRHASSLKAHRKVVDVELLPYLNGRKGIVVFRPK